MVHLEYRYSHIKDWYRKLFFVSDIGWEFPVNEASCQEFLVRALWSWIPDCRDFNMTLSRREMDHLDLIYFLFGPMCFLPEKT